MPTILESFKKGCVSNERDGIKDDALHQTAIARNFHKMHIDEIEDVFDDMPVT